MPPIQQLSPFKQHCERWKNGCGSDQCEAAQNIVFCRGKLPCDVLFIGEGPGESEDALGLPFIGPTGKLLDSMIEETMPMDAIPTGDDPIYTPIYQLAFTNIVGCIPRDEENAKAGEPAKPQIEACRPRLREFVKIAKPKLIVTVGKLSTKWTPEAIKGIKIETVELIHPAAILKSHITEKGLLLQRATATLSTIFEELTT